MATEAESALELARAVRGACIAAALDGYERAQIAGLCQEGAWEAAVDAIRLLDLSPLLARATPDPRRDEPASA